VCLALLWSSVRLCEKTWNTRGGKSNLLRQWERLLLWSWSKPRNIFFFFFSQRRRAKAPRRITWHHQRVKRLFRILPTKSPKWVTWLFLKWASSQILFTEWIILFFQSTPTYKLEVVKRGGQAKSAEKGSRKPKAAVSFVFHSNVIFSGCGWLTTFLAFFNIHEGS